MSKVIATADGVIKLLENVVCLTLPGRFRVRCHLSLDCVALMRPTCGRLIRARVGSDVGRVV